MSLSPTWITWALIVIGLLFLALPILYLQLLMILRPYNQKTKDLWLGKGGDWRDDSHFRFAYGSGWADLGWWLPLLVVGSIGVLLGQAWGYVLWVSSASIAVYHNVILWFSDHEYAIKLRGPLVYYTVEWGFFVYWGVAVVIYSLLRLVGITL